MQRNKKTKNFECILVCANSKRDFKRGIVPYSHVIIQQALRQVGIEPHMVDINDHKKIEAFKNDISLPQIWGIGSYLEESIHAFTLCEEIKKKDPDHRFIILGGPITEHADLNGAYLIKEWADAINYGHAQPFVDFMSAVKELELNIPHFRSLAEKHELATRKHQTVPLGAFPHLEKIPLTTRTVNRHGKKEFHVYIPPYDTCSNKCQYCTSAESRIPDMTAKIIQSMQQLVAEQKPKITHIRHTNATFTPRVIKSMQMIYAAAQDNSIRTTLTVGSEIFTEKRYDKTMEAFRSLKVTGGTLAVDCVDADVALAIGRKYHGEIRDAQLLKEEVEGVIRFLNDHHDWILPGQEMRFQINVLLSPFDTPTSIQKVIDFFRRALLAQSMHSYLRVGVSTFCLSPYPSSELAKRYMKNIDLKKLVWNAHTDIFRYDTDMWKFEEEKYGIEFIKALKEPYAEAYILGQTRKSEPISNYLFIESLSMTKQYLEGVQRFEDMQITRMSYKENAKDLRKLYDALVGQQ